ncbi:unnamed protein product [Durusdinium trenchii]|uniref:Uncharacterized protein n=1 Tax=Durusdinium trenchii TaxID=1381693 RepID=A0ABP0QJF4_9DINO
MAGLGTSNEAFSRWSWTPRRDGSPVGSTGDGASVASTRRMHVQLVDCVPGLRGLRERVLLKSQDVLADAHLEIQDDRNPSQPCLISRRLLTVFCRFDPLRRNSKLEVSDHLSMSPCDTSPRHVLRCTVACARVRMFGTPTRAARDEVVPSPFPKFRSELGRR